MASPRHEEEGALLRQRGRRGGERRLGEEEEVDEVEVVGSRLQNGTGRELSCLVSAAGRRGDGQVAAGGVRVVRRPSGPISTDGNRAEDPNKDGEKKAAE